MPLDSIIRRVPVAFTGPNVDSLPLVSTIDPIEAAGSLFLIDPTHPLNPWAAGVPAHDAVVPNLFAAKAAALIGGGALAENQHGIVGNPGTLTGSKGLVERTTKGGVHVVQSVTATAPGSDRWGVKIPSGIDSYIAANKTNHFYVSAWFKTTRLHTASAPTEATYVQVRNFTQQALVLNESGPAPTAGSPAGERYFVGNGALGIRRASARIIPASGYAAGGNDFWAWIVGNTANTAGADRGKQGGRVFYRVYIEDLTVSGRAYAQADAIEASRFTNQVLTAGGRYYGDTHTDASTVPA